MSSQSRTNRQIRSPPLIDESTQQIPPSNGTASQNWRDEVPPPASARGSPPVGVTDASPVLESLPSSPSNVSASPVEARSHSALSPGREKCWICLAEEGESETTADGSSVVNESRFCKACQCSLVAHENCLITWINNSRRSGHPNQKITCPQCKSEYRLAQSASIFYKLASHYNYRINQLSPLALGGSLVLGTSLSLGIYGFYAMCATCGPELSAQILSPKNLSRPGFNARLVLGLPFIPLWLVSSRLSYFDSLLPIIPLIFLNHSSYTSFVGTAPNHPPGTLTLPPALTFCVLPWFRIIYNSLWKKFITPLERKWIDPNQTGVLGEDVAIRDVFRGDGVVIDVEIEAEIPQHNGRRNPQPDAARNNQNQIQNNNNNDVVIRASPSLSSICRLIIGALLLPDICAMAGWGLGHLAWFKRYVPGRFERNIMGGLMVLVMKDAMGIWFKYAGMKSRKSLAVLDWDGRRGNGLTERRRR